MADNSKGQRPDQERSSEESIPAENLRSNPAIRNSSAAPGLDEKSSGVGRRDKSTGLSTKDGVTGSDLDGQVTQ